MPVTSTMTNMPVLRTGQMHDYLTRMVWRYNKPVWVWGPSGIGKSAIAKAWSEHMADQLGLVHYEVKFDRETGKIASLPKGVSPEDVWGFIDLRAVLLDVLDVKGAPYLDKEAEMTRFLRASILPDILRHGFHGLLFLDELAQAVPMVSNSLSQLIYDGKIGDSYAFPEQWRILAAGNRKSDNAATAKAGAHIYNRFAHVELLPDVESYSEWLIDNGGDWRVARFLLFRADLLHDYKKGDIVFPTPRSYEDVSKIVTTEYDNQIDLTNSAMEIDIASLIGTSAAADLCGFLEVISSLPSYAEIVKNPEDAKLPAQGDPKASAIYHATIGMLSNHAKRSDIEQVMQYVERMQPEWQSAFICELNARRKDLIETSRVTQWRVDHPSHSI